jgi:diguanylate cyclase (GGDEF)-like protein/putative nucleotidyltransferase with HDIG domain
MIDLDHLCTINNTHGHLVGDRVIQAVADVLGEVVGRRGVAARFGGEEFCLLLPGQRPGVACDITEAARARVAGLDLVDDQGRPVRATLSAGIAAFSEHGDTVDGLLKAADDAVYDAKTGGRNRVRVALTSRARDALHEGVRPGRLGGSRPAAIEEPAVAPGRVEGSPASAFDAADLPPRSGERPRAPLTIPPAPQAAEPEPPSPADAGRPLRPLALLALGVCVAAGAVAATSSLSPIVAAPVLFGLLVAAVVALDLVNIDLFDRGKISPGSVPSLALAFAFGPLGPLTAELVAAARRLARREPAVSWAIDLGNLSLAGAAAALAFQLVPHDGLALTLVAATVGGMAYYAVNAALLAAVWRLAEGIAPLAAWRERFAWAWWHYLGYGALAGAFMLFERRVGPGALAALILPIFMLWLSQKQYLDRSRTSVAELRRSHDDLADANGRLQRLLDDNEELLGRMHRSYLSTITSLARTIEAKDPYTGGHTDRVAQIASLIARELGFNESELRALEVGAVIHDIGKIGIPDAILLKRGRLTESEFDEMRRHPEISSYIVAELELPPIVKQVVRNHHERYDGRGYPDGLAGEEIPIAARILTVADAFDAMTSDRPYRAALSPALTRAELEAEAGRQFCPRVIAALGRSFDSAPEFWAELEREATIPFGLTPRRAPDVET